MLLQSREGRDPIALARHIVASPGLYPERLIRLAWSVLVTARDGRVRQSRLGFTEAR